MKTLSKILSVVLCLAVVMAMFVIGASAANFSITLTASELGLDNGTVFTSKKIDHISFEAAKNSGSSDPAYYTKGTAIRLYKQNSMTITPDAGYGISKITITTDSGNPFKDSNHSVSNCSGSLATINSNTEAVIIPTDSASPVVITYTASSGHIRIQKIVIEYVDGVSAHTHDGEATTNHMDGTHHWKNYACGEEVPGSKTTHSTPTCSCGYKEGSVSVATTVGTYYKVTGQVVYISGQNVYLQDSTGAICAYFKYDADLSALEVGQWITVTAAYKLYNGLPELDAVPSYAPASAGTAGSPVTSLADLGTDDICKPFAFTNLTITEIDGSNYTLSDGSKTVVCRNLVYAEGTPAVGDFISSISGVVSVYKKDAASLSELTIANLQLNNDKEKTSTCAHAEMEWKAEGSKHWQACKADGCTYKTDVCETAPSPKNDATHHWTECLADGCDYATTKVEHTQGADDKCTGCGYNMACNHEYEPKKDDTHHWNGCKHCGDVEGGAKTAHTVKYDDNQHWTECACGHTTDKAYHTLSNNKCACGYEKATGYIKVTDGKLTSGKYVMVLTNGYAPTTMDGTYLLSGQPTISGNKVTNPNTFIVTLTVEGNKVTIKDANGKIIINKSGENSLVANATEGSWTWEYVDGSFRFHDGAEGDDRRYLASNSQLENKFRAYRLNSSQASSQTNTFVLYKLNTNANTGDNSVVSVAIAAAVLSVLGTAVLVMKKKEF